jgi:hypothetical protein
MHPTDSTSPEPPTEQKKMWTLPVITVTQLNTAGGADVGPLCDRYGSLSHGRNCD